MTSVYHNQNQNYSIPINAINVDEVFIIALILAIAISYQILKFSYIQCMWHCPYYL